MCHKFQHNAFYWHIRIQELSRTVGNKFKDFQGHMLFSRTFQALKISTKNSRTLLTCGHPENEELHNSAWSLHATDVSFTTQFPQKEWCYCCNTQIHLLLITILVLHLYNNRIITLNCQQWCSHYHCHHFSCLNYQRSLSAAAGDLWSQQWNQFTNLSIF